MPIYFIRAGGMIKIGFSLEVRQRLKELQTAQPVRLELLGVMAGDSDAERTLHERFAFCRQTGEWFSAVDELMLFIEANTQLPAPKPKGVRAPSAFDKKAASKILLDFFRAKHPGNAHNAVAAVTDIPRETVHTWFKRGSLPSCDHILRLIEVYGPPFLVEVVAPSIGRQPQAWMFPPSETNEGSAT